MESTALFAATAITAAAMMADGARATEFSMRSTAFISGEALPGRYHGNAFGCSGGNFMPDLHWSNAPSGTKSFAVTLYDKDAPTGSGFWHWIAYDLPPSTTSLPGGEHRTPLPFGAVEGNTDLGKPGFFGPCPPPGRLHHYVYSIYALDIEKLPVGKDASPAMTGFLIWQHQLAKATLGFHLGPRDGKPLGPRQDQRPTE